MVAAIAAGLILAVGIGLPIGLLARGHQSTSVNHTSPPPAPSNSAAAGAAATFYNQALAATRGAAGFHYVADTNGTGSQRIVGDAGRATGRQVITMDSAYGAEEFTLLLVGTTVDFQGNAPALQDQLGLSVSKAASLQGKWISVAAGDGPYSVLQPGITVADQAQEMALVPESTTNVTANGANAIRVVGTVPSQRGAPAGTGHLDIAAGSHLPIAYVSTLSLSGATLSTTTTFTSWGTVLPVSAPSGAVAWSTLGATEPPGGYGSGGANPGASPTPQGTV